MTAPPPAPAAASADARASPPAGALRDAPRWLLCALVPAVALAAPVDQAGSPDLYKTVAALAGAAALALWFWVQRAVRAPAPLAVPALLVPLLLLLAWAGASLIWAHHRSAGAEVLVKWSAAVLVFFLVASELDRARWVRRLVIGVFAGAVLLAVLAAAQHLFLLGWIPQSPARPAATFGNKNMLMQYMVLAVPLGAGLLLAARGRAASIVAALLLATAVATFGLTGTRAAIVAGTVQLLLLAAFMLVECRRGRAPVHARLKLALALCIALGAFAAARVPPGALAGAPAIPAGAARAPLTALPQLASDSALASGGSVRQRLTMWRETLDMIADHWALGVGIGNWFVHYPLYARSLTGDRHLRPVLRAHDSYLEIAAGLGIVGVALAAWVAAGALRLWSRALARADDERIVVAVLGIALAGAGVNAVFSFVFELAMPCVAALALLGALAAIGVRRGAVPARTVALPVRGWACLQALALVLLVGVLLAGRARRAEDVQLHLAAQHARAAQWLYVDRHARAALRSNPFSGGGHIDLARSAAARGHFPEAVKHLERFLEREPFNYRALVLYAGSLANSSRVEQGLAVALRCLRMRPDDVEMVETAATLAQHAGDVRQAATLRRRAAALRAAQPR